VADSRHCEGVRPEAISMVKDCFVVSLLAMTAHIKHVTKLMANWYGAGVMCCRAPPPGC